MNSPQIPRRTLFRAAAAGVAVAAAPTLIGCSTKKVGSVGSAGMSVVPWPTYIPAKTAAPDLPGTAAGVEPAYLKYPTELVTSVNTKPGDGSDVTAVIISYSPPPTPVSDNKFWQAINAALGVNLKLTLVPGNADYPNKMATIEAGGDLPDILLAAGSGVPQEAAFVQAKCADLSDYLSGDNIKKYPNLANIPTYAWQAVGHIGGKLYGVPVTRARSGDIMMANQTMLNSVGGLSTWDKDQFVTEMTSVTKANRWALGAIGTNRWGLNFHGPSWSLPNIWKVDNGTFTSMVADPLYKDVLNYMVGLYKAGLYYPNTATVSTTDLKTLFYNGTVVTDVDGFVAYSSAITAVNNQYVVDFARHYQVGGKTTQWFGPGYAGYVVLKQAPKARIEMLLRILDYLAAPFGTKEYELNHFGVEGQHFTRSADGQIVPTALAKTENPNTVPIRYISDAPPVSFYPTSPDAAQRQHAYESDSVPVGVANPAGGLHTDTYDRVQSKLLQIETDGITAVVTGRQPVSSWDDVVKQWKQAGGDASAAELAKEYAANTAH